MIEPSDTFSLVHWNADQAQKHTNPQSVCDDKWRAPVLTQFGG
jgi:hypothetical protein